MEPGYKTGYRDMECHLSGGPEPEPVQGVERYGRYIIYSDIFQNSNFNKYAFIFSCFSEQYNM